MSGAPISPDVRTAEVTQAAFGRAESPASKRVAAIREAVANNKGPGSPLEKMRPAILETSSSPTTTGVNKDFLGKNFGSDIDPVTGQMNPSPESLTRRNNTETSINLARSATKYDSLSLGDRQALIIHAERILTADPNIAATLPPPGPERSAWIESNYLGDPRVVAKIQEKITALEGERLSNPTDIAQREVEVDQATAEHARKEARERGLTQESTRIQTRKADFEPGQKAYQQIKDFETSNPGYNRQQLDRLEARITALTAQLQGRRSAAEMESINQLINQLETQAEPMRTYESLKAEEARLPQDEIRVGGELTAAQAETKAALTKQLIAKANLDQAQTTRAEAEQTLVDRANSIITESIREVMKEDYDTYDAEWQRQIDEFTASSKDIAEKALGRQAKDRYVQEKTQSRMDKIKGIQRTEANVVRAVSDFNIILTDPINGPKQLLERALRDGLSSDVEAGVIEAGEVDGIVAARMNDPEWVENMSLMVGGNALREVRKLGPFKEAEAAKIARSKIGEKILQSAMSEPKDNPSEVNAVVEELKKKGMVTPDKMDEKTKNWIINTLVIIGSALMPVAKTGVDFK